MAIFSVAELSVFSPAKHFVPVKGADSHLALTREPHPHRSYINGFPVAISIRYKQSVQKVVKRIEMRNGGATILPKFY